MPTQTQREIADAVLSELFKRTNRIAIADAVAAASAKGVSRRTLTRAAKALDVREVHNGPYGAFWEKIT